MGEGFELLEEKVRKAADLVTRLRRENRELTEERGRLGARLQEAEKGLRSVEKDRGASAAESRRLEAMAQEVAALRQEREEVRRRIASLVEVLDALESL